MENYISTIKLNKNESSCLTQSVHYIEKPSVIRTVLRKSVSSR